MKRSERLGTILDLSESREKDAAQKLGQLAQKLETARRNLENLQGFRDSYTAKFRDSGDQGLGMRRLLEFRAFLSKINSAVLEQEKLVAHAERALAKGRADWEAARRQTMGLKTVVDKARTEEGKLEERRRQAEEDERASRRGDRAEGLFSAGF